MSEQHRLREQAQPGNCALTKAGSAAVPSVPRKPLEFAVCRGDSEKGLKLSLSPSCHKKIVRTYKISAAFNRLGNQLSNLALSRGAAASDCGYMGAAAMPKEDRGEARPICVLPHS